MRAGRADQAHHLRNRTMSASVDGAIAVFACTRFCTLLATTGAFGPPGKERHGRLSANNGHRDRSRVLTFAPATQYD